MTGRRAFFAERLAERNAGGLLYGAIVTAATIAVASGEAGRGFEVAVAVGAVLVTYWLAHVYVTSMTARLAGRGARTPALFVQSAKHDSTVLLGGLPALVFFAAEIALGVDVERAGDVALWLSVVMLMAVAYLAGHAGGLTGRRLALETAGAGLLGSLAVLLKALLH